MIDLRGRGALIATGIAVGLHVVLFLGVPKTETSDSMLRRKAPFTGYNVFPATADDVLSGVNAVRVFNSPVHFSLPTSMGFSRFLKMKRAEARTFFVPQVEPAETFLDMELPVQPIRSAEDFHKLQVLRADRSLVVPPINTVSTGMVFPKCFLMDDVLQDRLAADPVLPEEFNQPVEKAWEILATVQVTESGRVEHVFLEHPLENAALNQKILQFLYGLRFKPGASIEAKARIYSPEATLLEGAES